MAKDDAIGLVARINTELDKATQKADKLLKALGSGNNAAGGGGVMSGSLGRISTLANNSFHMSTMAAAGGLMKSGLGTAAVGAFNMMPDVNATISRMGGFYTAGVRMGGISTTQLQSKTTLGLAGGLSYAGADADVAAYASRAFVSGNSSAYQAMLRSAGNATKYLNMDTVQAFAAVEQLGSGQGSGNFMSRYGIFTTDPTTGREKTQGQIFSELADRLTMGHKKQSVEETMRNLRGGFLGYEVRNSGMTDDQQALFSQFMIERAKGNNMDLSDPRALAKLSDPNNPNPFAPAYAINTAQTGAMQTAQQNYLSTIEAAVPLIEAMNKAAGELATTFLGTAKAFAAVTFGDNATSGGIGALGGLSQMAAATFLGARAAGGLGKGGKASKSMAATSKSGSRAMTAAKGFGAGAVASIAGEGVKALTGNQQGSQGNKLGNALSMAGTFASVASLAGFIPGVNAFTPLIMGGAALVGGAIGYATGGEENSIGTGGTTDTSAGAFQRPVESTAISASYGQKGSVWAAGYHKGTDYPVPVGTAVYAAAEGTVSKAHHGSGSHSFGLYVAIDHANGYTTIYAHLSQALVHPGDSVTKGQLIGKSGQSGNVTGPHLHFEVRKNGVAVSPGSLAGGVQGGGAPSTSKGNGTANAVTRGSEANILDLVLGKGSSGITPSITVSNSGVKGNFQTSSQMVGNSMKGGSLSLASPVIAATGTVAAVGGEGSAIALGTSSVGAPSPLSSEAAMYGTSSTLRGAGPVVNISVNLSNSSAMEAKKLAELVKSYLEEDAALSNVGRR
jgi:murein DD-endopeptidase MepM/ murein hydrolase activator NlpD